MYESVMVLFIRLFLVLHLSACLLASLLMQNVFSLH